MSLSFQLFNFDRLCIKKQIFFYRLSFQLLGGPMNGHGIWFEIVEIEGYIS